MPSKHRKIETFLRCFTAEIVEYALEKYRQSLLFPPLLLFGTPHGRCQTLIDLPADDSDQDGGYRSFSNAVNPVEKHCRQYTGYRDQRDIEADLHRAEFYGPHLAHCKDEALARKRHHICGHLKADPDRDQNNTYQEGRAWPIQWVRKKPPRCGGIRSQPLQNGAAKGLFRMLRRTVPAVRGTFPKARNVPDR